MLEISPHLFSTLLTEAGPLSQTQNPPTGLPYGSGDPLSLPSEAGIQASCQALGFCKCLESKPVLALAQQTLTAETSPQLHTVLVSVAAAHRNHARFQVSGTNHRLVCLDFLG